MTGEQEGILGGIGYDKTPNKIDDVYLENATIADLVKIVDLIPVEKIQADVSLTKELLRAERLNAKRGVTNKVVSNILSGKTKAILPAGYILPPGIKLTPSQILALCALAIRPKLILAMEMGLGKTIVCLTHIVNEIANGRAPHLIVCPSRIRINYKQELWRYFPDLVSKTLILNKTEGENLEMLEQMS